MSPCCPLAPVVFTVGTVSKFNKSIWAVGPVLCVSVACIQGFVTLPLGDNQLDPRFNEQMPRVSN